MPLRRAVGLGALLVAVLCSAPDAVAKPAEVPNFNLPDLNGRNHELRRAEGKVVVLFFTGNGCPIARQSISKLKRLHEQFGKDVTFWMVNTYSEDSSGDCHKEYQEFKMWPLTYLRDSKQGLAAAFGVERTAEVIANAPSHRNIFSSRPSRNFSMANR